MNIKLILGTTITLIAIWLIAGMTIDHHHTLVIEEPQFIELPSYESINHTNDLMDDQCDGLKRLEALLASE